VADKKEKTISYRRAEWLIDQPDSISLELCLKQTVNNLKNVKERTVVRATGQHLRLAHIKKSSKGGFYLHLTADTPGEAASIVPTIALTSEEIQISKTAPPANAEFMDGDAFVFIKEDHVCLCTTGMHDTTIRLFLHHLFREAKIRQDATKFDLQKIADISKLKLLQTQGVKEIELRSMLYQATADYTRRKTQTLGMLGAAAKQIKSILAMENDVNTDALRVALTLKVDRRRKGITLGEKRIKSLAINLIKDQESDDDYVIITKDNQKIGPSEIFMRSTVSIDSDGKTVQRDKAWIELKAFYDMLENSGALEQ
jgi:hypothetical protein